MLPLCQVLAGAFIEHEELVRRLVYTDRDNADAHRVHLSAGGRSAVPVLFRTFRVQLRPAADTRLDVSSLRVIRARPRHTTGDEANAYRGVCKTLDEKAIFRHGDPAPPAV